MWAITTLVAPVVGPLLGGWITDNISWPWIFYINVPVGIVSAFAVWVIYRDRETPTVKLPIDSIGLGLLVIWVGAMQIVLDKGKDLDWFHSNQIIILAIVAVVGFAIFIVWELTDQHPVVDLRLFGRRNFWTATVAMSVAYGLFFGNLVLLPLWLQQYMGYTATWAGIGAGAGRPCSPSCSRRWSGRNITRVDPRVFCDRRIRLVRRRAVHALALQHQCRHCHADDTDAPAGRLDGGVFHSTGHTVVVGPVAQPHSGGVGIVQLRAYQCGIVRGIDRHHVLGPACQLASRAAGREHHCVRSGIERRHWPTCRRVE